MPVSYRSERVSASYGSKGFAFDEHDLSVVRTKSLAWSYEREWRQLFQLQDCTTVHNPDGSGPTEPPPTEPPPNPEEPKPPPPNGGWSWHPEYGWGYFPMQGGKPQPPGSAAFSYVPIPSDAIASVTFGVRCRP